MRRVFLISALMLISGPVWAQSLTVSSMRHLEFGNQIFPGVDKIISRTDASAAKFHISGEGGRQVQITFQLPAYLTDSFGNNLSISFNTTDAGYNTVELGQGMATAFDPNTGVITSLGIDGNLYIWLGGTLSPLSSQQGNPYSGDIAITATYTN